MKQNLDLLNNFWRFIENGTGFRQYLPLIKKAVPFSLDEDAARLVAEMTSDPSKVNQISIYKSLAKLPFEHVWIEFPMQALVKRQNELTGRITAKEGTTERFAFLLQRGKSGTEEGELIYVSMVSETEENPVLYPITALFWEPGLSSDQLEYAIRILSKNPDYDTFFKDTNKWLVQSERLAWGLQDEFFAPLANSVLVIPEAQFLSHVKRGNYTKKHFSQLLEVGLTESLGFMRLLVATLAVINYVPVKLEPYRMPGKMRLGGNIKPFMSTSIVRIQIPNRKRRIRDVERTILAAYKSHRKRHRVRGHWRVSNKSHGDHWEMFIDYFSMKIKWRRWINNHERGDATLGWVNQTYVVERT